jgi:alpha-tubulin suppressor-like RCC1 family protein
MSRNPRKLLCVFPWVMTTSVVAQSGSLVGWGGALLPPAPRAEGTAYTTMSGGEGFMLAIHPDGSVVGWGNNVDGQISVPASLGPCIDVSAGSKHALAVRGDGVVVAWGQGDFGRTTVPTTLGVCKQVSAGSNHSLALTVDGSARGWGDSAFGQLALVGSVPCSMIQAGHLWSVMLRPDGGVTGCGQYVSSGTTNRLAYSQPGDLPALTKIATRHSHVVGLSTAGVVRAWGRNAEGQCTVPTTLGTCVDVAAGRTFSLALRSSGSVVAWGASDLTTVPAAAAGANRVFASYQTAAVMKSDGSITTWGGADSPSLLTVPGRQVQIQSLALSQPPGALSRTVVVDAAGEVRTFGAAFTGLARPSNLGPCTQVSMLFDHVLALKVDGTVAAWGTNTAGQCTVPPSATSVIQVAAGSQFSLALKSNGTTVGWGSGTGGATFDAGVGAFTQIAAGSQFSLGLRTDGIVVGSQGSNTSGQVSIPASLGACTSIACGTAWGLAIRTDGTVGAWGYNVTGQTNVPADLGACQQVAASNAVSLALKADGTIRTWGQTGNAVLTAPAGKFTRIFAGGNVAAALVADDCQTPGRAGTATIAVNGSFWRFAPAWSWSDGGAGIPGILSTVDLGSYGTVKTDCAAQAATFTARSGSKLYVDIACDAGDCPNPSVEALEVAGTATLAGTLKVDFQGCAGCTSIPETFDAATIVSANGIVGTFGLLQTNLPAPAGRFPSLVPETVGSRSLLTFRLLEQSRGASLSPVGTVSPPVAGGTPVGGAAIDLDGDGFQDLLAAIDYGSASNGSLWTRLSDGSGGFTATSCSTSVPPQPRCLATGDVDLDGTDDVVAGFADGTVRVYLNGPGCTLVPGTVISNLGGTPTCVVVIPPDGTSLVGGASIGIGVTSKKVWLFSIDGVPQGEIALAGVPNTIRGGNTGGTQGTDIVTGGSKSASGAGFALGQGFIDVLRKGTGGYSVVQSFTLNGQPVGLDVADLDADGVDDVVSANAAPESGASGSEPPVLSILRSAGGMLADPVPFRPEGAVAGVSVALVDVDIDGDRDIVSVDQTIGGVRQTRLLRVDTAGPGTPLSLKQVMMLASTEGAIAVRANLDGGVGEDLILVDRVPPSNPSGFVQGTGYVAVPDPLPGDLDGDDVVSNADIGLLLLDFGPCPGCASDLDGNGEVDSGDIAFLLLLFS